MKTLDEQLIDCNDIAKERARKQIEKVVLESEQMLILMSQKVMNLRNHFDEIPVEVAIQYGIWARESLVALYGPGLFEDE